MNLYASRGNRSLKHDIRGFHVRDSVNLSGLLPPRSPFTFINLQGPDGVVLAQILKPLLPVLIERPLDTRISITQSTPFAAARAQLLSPTVTDGNTEAQISNLPKVPWLVRDTTGT